MKYIWDLFYGIIVIGGAPWGVLLLMEATGCILDVFIKNANFDNIAPVIAFVGFTTAILIFTSAIIYRSRIRVLPQIYIICEVILGVTWSTALLFFYGVVGYSAIG